MAARKRRSMSFDTMVRMFLRDYGIPTKKDVEKLMNRLDHLEQMIRTFEKKDPPPERPGRSDAMAAASEAVIGVIRRHPEGAGFAGIREETGFGEKKLRNIIYRLSKSSRIKRISRGLYIAS